MAETDRREAVRQEGFYWTTYADGTELVVRQWIVPLREGRWLEPGVAGDYHDEDILVVSGRLEATAAAEIDRLRSDCAEAYQAVGVLANVVGWWEMPPDHPWHAPIEKLLNNLSAAAEGEPRKHHDLLPFVMEA
jgi:hypothetical protein